MKRLILTVFLIGATASAFAQSPGNPAPNPAINVFTATPNITNFTAGTSWGVVTARSGNAGAPVVQSIYATTTNVLLGQLIFYRVTAQVAVTLTNSTTNLFVVDTNGFANSQIVVVRHMSDDSYERRVTAASNGTNATTLPLTIATANTIVPGDIVYQVTTNAIVPWNTTNGPITAAAIYVGQAQKPLLIDFVGAGALQQLNFVSGRFEPPVIVPRPGL